MTKNVTSKAVTLTSICDFSESRCFPLLGKKRIVLRPVDVHRNAELIFGEFVYNGSSFTYSVHRDVALFIHDRFGVSCLSCIKLWLICYQLQEADSLTVGDWRTLLVFEKKNHFPVASDGKSQRLTLRRIYFWTSQAPILMMELSANRRCFTDWCCDSVRVYTAYVTSSLRSILETISGRQRATTGWVTKESVVGIESTCL